MHTSTTESEQVNTDREGVRQETPDSIDEPLPTPPKEIPAKAAPKQVSTPRAKATATSSNSDMRQVAASYEPPKQLVQDALRQFTIFDQVSPYYTNDMF